MKKIILGAALFAVMAGALVMASPSVLRAASTIVGGVDGLDEYENFNFRKRRVNIVGWAGATSALGDAQNRPVTVTVTSPTLGNQVVDQFETSIARADAQNVYGGNLNKGFNWSVPARFRTGDKYDFNFYASVDPKEYGKYPIGAQKGVAIPDLGLRGAVDRLTNNSVNGWAADFDGDDLATQTTAVFVTIDGQQVAMSTTGQRRDDVADYWRNAQNFSSFGSNHGYSFNINVPSRFRDGKVHTFHVFALEFTEGAIMQIGGPMYRTIKTDGTFGTN